MEESKIRLLIDVGSSVTKVFRYDYNAVFAEATYMIQIDKRLVFGNEAKRYAERRTKGIREIFPIVDGYVQSARDTAVFLKYVFRTVGLQPRDLKNTEVILAVPCNLPGSQFELWNTVFRACDIRTVHFVDSVHLLAIAFTENERVQVNDPFWVVDMGTDCVNVAIMQKTSALTGTVYRNVILKCCCLNGGNGNGENIDELIIHSVRNDYRYDITLTEARLLKEAIGTVVEGDERKKTVYGVFAGERNGEEEPFTVSARELQHGLKIRIDSIVSEIARMRSRYKNEAGGRLGNNDLGAKGAEKMYFVGGCALIPGIAQCIEEKLGVKLITPQYPEFATVSMGATLRENPTLLDSLYIRGDRI